MHINISMCATAPQETMTTTGVQKTTTTSIPFGDNNTQFKNGMCIV